MELSNVITYYEDQVEDCNTRIHDIENGEYDGDDEMYDFTMKMYKTKLKYYQEFLDSLLKCVDNTFTSIQLEKAYNDGKYSDFGEKFDVEIYRKK